MDFKVPIAERSEVWKNQRQFSELQKKAPAPEEKIVRTSQVRNWHQSSNGRRAGEDEDR